ncbi:unnamed protein product [Discula destructiva]
MADERENSYDGLGVCPSSPRPRKATLYNPRDDQSKTENGVADAANNDHDGLTRPAIIMFPPLGPFGGRWNRGPPPSDFGDIRLQLPHYAGHHIPHAGTVFGTQHRPPTGPIAINQPRYSPDNLHGSPPPAGSIFGNRPNTVALESSIPQLHAPFGPGQTSIDRSVRRYPVSGMEKCHPLASTRVYNKNLRCDRCGGRSALGWYYRCSHEADARLYESIQNGNEEYLDDIGEKLSKQLKQPVRGPAARQDKLSPLNELTDEQLESLSAPQLAKILRQHEKAINTALEERHGPVVPPADDKPFLMPQVEECRTTLCPRCGRVGNGEQQAFLSLDGVLNGDIPPAAAVGFGFRALGGRPVANANIVKNLGLRDPQTGLLPGQRSNVETAAGAGAAAAKESAQAAGDNAKGSGMDDSKLSERTAALNLDDASNSPHADGLNTAAGSLKAVDSDDDLFQLYMDSEEDTLAGSLQESPVEDVENLHWSQL